MQYVKRMLPLFRAVVKFCSSNWLFKLESMAFVIIVNLQKSIQTCTLSLARTARFLSLATEILSSFVSNEQELPEYLILKIVVSDMNLLYVCPANSKFSSPAKKIFVLGDENRAVCARL